MDPLVSSSVALSPDPPISIARVTTGAFEPALVFRDWRLFFGPVITTSTRRTPYKGDFDAPGGEWQPVQGIRGGGSMNMTRRRMRAAVAVGVAALAPLIA